MKKIYALLLIMMSIGAVGCSSVQDEANLDDSVADSEANPTSAQANTDSVPVDGEVDALAAAKDAPPAPPAPPAEEMAPPAPVEDPMPLADGAPIVDPAMAAPADGVITPPAQDAIVAQAPEQPVIDTPVISAPVVADIAPSQPSEPVPMQDMGGEKYRVKQGDTLMKIAFENYGDLYRWREIYESNRANIQDPNHVPPGTVLHLSGAGKVQIERNGEQYLIKHGDTLGSISGDVYGTRSKWKDLWENNRQLIKDPNKIYAGFYLYYRPIERVIGSTKQ